MFLSSKCVAKLAAVFSLSMTAYPALAVVPEKAPLAKSAVAVRSHAGSIAKTKHGAKHAGASRRYKAWMVPPPPAYMPSILPESYRHSGQATTDVAVDGEDPKPENPYKKYVHTPAGDAPEPVQARKGVVTWSQRN